MSNLNKIIATGNLTLEPRINYLNNETAVCKFSIAINRWVKKNNKFEKRTTYLNITTWNGLAEKCYKMLKVGSEIYLEGRFETYSFEDKDGNTRYGFNVVAERVTLLKDRLKKVV